MMELHALAENYKEIPITSWAIKTVVNNDIVGRVIKVDDGFNLVSEYKNQNNYPSLMSAVNDLATIFQKPN